MKKILIFIISIAILPCTYGQKVKTKRNETFMAVEKYEVLKSDKKILHGKYTKQYKLDNTTLIKGQYKDNRKIGIWEYYDFRSKKLEQKYDYGNNKIIFSETLFLDRTQSDHFKYNGEWIYDKLDSLPKRIGGISDLKLKLTEEAFKYYKAPDFPNEGIAIFSFIITKDGKTKDYKILTSTGNTFENELLNLLIESDGKWIPAMYKGEYVESEFIIPMNVKYKENTQGLKRFTIDFNRPH